MGEERYCRRELEVEGIRMLRSVIEMAAPG